MSIELISLKNNKWLIDGEQLQFVDDSNKEIVTSKRSFYPVRFKNVNKNLKPFLESDGLAYQQALTISLENNIAVIKKDHGEYILEITFSDNAKGTWSN